MLKNYSNNDKKISMKLKKILKSKYIPVENVDNDVPKKCFAGIQHNISTIGAIFGSAISCLLQQTTRGTILPNSLINFLLYSSLTINNGTPFTYFFIFEMTLPAVSFPQRESLY